MRAGYAVGLFRLLPVGVLDAVVGLMGINASMDHFVQTRSAPPGWMRWGCARLVRNTWMDC